VKVSFAQYEVIRENSFLTSALGGHQWLASPSGPFTQGKNLGARCRRLGEPHSRSGHFVKEQNLFPLLAFELWTVQPVTSFWACCRQPQEMLLVFSMYATCFGRNDHPQACNYMILKPTVKCIYTIVITIFLRKGLTVLAVDLHIRCQTLLEDLWTI
jgi:hypothetical protein